AAADLLERHPVIAEAAGIGGRADTEPDFGGVRILASEQQSRGGGLVGLLGVIKLLKNGTLLAQFKTQSVHTKNLMYSTDQRSGGVVAAQ
ncbi:hypothetical protein, partial [Parachitinimonas caeni]